jgi:hypothetical protein
VKYWVQPNSRTPGGQLGQLGQLLCFRDVPSVPLTRASGAAQAAERTSVCRSSTFDKAATKVRSRKGAPELPKLWALDFWKNPKSIEKHQEHPRTSENSSQTLHKMSKFCGDRSCLNRWQQNITKLGLDSLWI